MKFDPTKFKAELEQFITTEAGLTPAEASKFFPLFEEMFNKQHKMFKEMRLLRKYKPTNDAACRDAIAKIDSLEIEMKKLNQAYHKRFFKILPASKVFDIIKAEAKFHRNAFKRMKKKTGYEK